MALVCKFHLNLSWHNNTIKFRRYTYGKIKMLMVFVFPKSLSSIPVELIFPEYIKSGNLWQVKKRTLHGKFNNENQVWISPSTTCNFKVKVMGTLSVEKEKGVISDIRWGCRTWAHLSLEMGDMWLFWWMFWGVLRMRTEYYFVNVFL